jgi:hypothetical protein
LGSSFGGGVGGTGRGDSGSGGGWREWGGACSSGGGSGSGSSTGIVDGPSSGSGSGSATCTASFGAGASASATIGAEYDTSNGFNFINEGSFSYTPPYFTTTGFTLNQLNLDVALTGIEKFWLDYSGYIGVTFTGALTGKMNFATTGTTALTVTLSNSITRRRRLGTGSESVPIYFPGEAVRTLLAYTDFPLSESVVAFCNVLVAGGRDRSVKMVSFNTSGTGSGELAIDWVVPWDKEFANKELTFQVRTSNKMASPVETKPFTTSMFTETDGVFTAPAMNEIVPFDSPYTVSWNASLLSYFKIQTGNLFHGEERESSTVKLEVAHQRHVDQDAELLLDRTREHGLCLCYLLLHRQLHKTRSFSRRRGLSILSGHQSARIQQYSVLEQRLLLLLFLVSGSRVAYGP